MSGIEKNGTLLFDSGLTTESDKVITYNGNIFINGDVDDNSFITASGNIEISGSVTNSEITSTSGKIIITGNIIQSRVEAFSEIHTGKYSTEATGNFILESLLKTNYFIFCNSIKGADSKLIISDVERNNISKYLLEYNRLFKELMGDMQKYKRVLQVLKVLGNKIDELEEEKKKKLLYESDLCRITQKKLKCTNAKIMQYKNLHNSDTYPNTPRIFIKSILPVSTEIVIGKRNKMINKELISHKLVPSLQVIKLLPLDDSDLYWERNTIE